VGRRAAAVAGPALLAACGLLSAPPAPAAPAPIATEEFRIPAADSGISLYLRNKHPAGMQRVGADRIVLFVHGATFPGETTFDLALNGYSWMDYIARHGYDVYLVDVRGYGKSTRPAAMDSAADQNEPIARTATAVADLGAAVEFILRRRGVLRLNLLAWSWGTSISGWYTAQHNERVQKLALYAPLWLSDVPAANTLGTLGAYRSVTREAMRTRWLNGVPEDKRADLIPPGWFDAFAAATMASDPGGAARTPPVLRAPNGMLADLRDFWLAGKPLYDPADIRVPTLLVHAEWDADTPNRVLYAYFERLVNAPYRRYVQIGEGTHFLMLEKNRVQLFQAVQQFLDEAVHAGQ